MLETVVGNVEFEEDDLYIFPEGLPGFEMCKRFLLWENPEYLPVSWIISAEDKDILFPLIPASTILKDYNPRNSHGNSAERVMIMLSLSQRAEEVTADLRAPFLLNSETKEGRQTILTDSKYSARHLVKNESYPNE